MEKRGVVLCLLSADTYAVRVIGDKVTPIVAVSLENVICPRLGNSDGSTQDEPNAWPAYDFARKLVLSQRVLIDQQGKAPDQRRTAPCYGQIPLIYARLTLVDYKSENKDVGHILVTEGWAKLREKSRTEDDYVAILSGQQQHAKDEKIGIWSINPLIRSISKDVDPQKLIKIKEFDGLVENILNGSTYNVLLFPSFTKIVVTLAGIRCPSAKHSNPEPFGLEAKQFVEGKLLQRQVKVQLLNFNGGEGDLYAGRILHPIGGDIAPLLLAEGLATIHQQSMIFLESSSELRQAETTGKSSRKNMYKDFDISKLRSFRVNGKVQSIKGSSILEIDNGDEIRRIYLSGCKIPFYQPDKPYDPRAFECRERLRKLLVGKVVNCYIDYSIEDRQYATVFLGDDCINEIIIKEGLAQILLSKQGQSDNIDNMAKYDAEAKAKKLGLYGPALSTVQLNDLSSKHTHQKSFPFLHFLENKRQKGTVEYFTSCSRLSVLIPSQNCVIKLNIAGVQPSDPKSRLGVEALKFVNDEFLQRDAEFEITAVDKVGCFIGNVYIDRSQPGKSNQKVSLAILIVEKGFVELNSNAAAKSKDKYALEEAENKAKTSLLGVWSDAGKKRFRMEYLKVYPVALIDIWDPVTVVLQLKGNELNLINQMLPKAKIPATQPMKGDFLAAVYQDKLYRVIVKNITEDGKTANVDYVELCISGDVPVKDLKILPQELVGIQPQAFAARIGGCKLFKVDESFNDQAMDYVYDLVGDGALYAHLLNTGKYPEVLLTDDESIDSGSINSMLLSEGYANFKNINVDDEFNDIMRDLEDIEAEARKEKKGAWVHGNIANNDEDEDEK